MHHLCIIRPHRNTAYLDVAYCYRLTNVVRRSVGRFVGLSVTLVSPAKTAEPMEMPFGLRIWVGPWNHVLDGGADPPWEGTILSGERGRPIVKYRHTMRFSVQKRLNRSRCHLGCGFGWAEGIVLDGDPQCSIGGGSFGGQCRPL